MAFRIHGCVIGATILCAGMPLLAVWFGAHAADPSQRGAGEGSLSVWRRVFTMPPAVPHPADNPPSAEKIALGERLFHDARLSVDGRIACASCHDPRLGFADGEVRGSGVSGRRLRRHTPTLWNAAWSKVLYWDGRAASLEDQARFPIEHPDEMGNALSEVAARLSSIDEYRTAFAKVFPGEPTVTSRSIGMAIATYERTLISPPTRFDRWISGEARALSADEIAGFRLFVGKARCIACHGGYAFSDHSFHDIGLPSDDPGRGAIIDVTKVTHAFKTPTLRELAWTAPYMHDGSKATLEDVVDHYSGGFVRRPTLSKDLNLGLRLSEAEKRALVAFLGSLSSDAPPRPSAAFAQISAEAPPAPAIAAKRVGQKDKKFRPGAVRLRLGETLTIVNDDTRTHNVRLDDPRWHFNTGAQEPGETIVLRTIERGAFTASCGIHPHMQLRIEVD
jgi:cytochrome c peroxidase